MRKSASSAAKPMQAVSRGQARNGMVARTAGRDVAGAARRTIRRRGPSGP